MRRFIIGFGFYDAIRVEFFRSVDDALAAASALQPLGADPDAMAWAVPFEGSGSFLDHALKVLEAKEAA